MEGLKYVCVLLVTVLVVNEAKPTGGHSRHCSKVRGRDCTKDIDCACQRHSHYTPLICNYNFKCEKESIYDTIARRVPCFRAFKNPCETNADCPPCSEAQLICEENECVRQKFMFAR